MCCGRSRLVTGGLPTISHARPPPVALARVAMWSRPSHPVYALFGFSAMGRRAPVVSKLRRGSGCPRAGVFEGVATPSNGSMQGRAREGWGGGPLSLRCLGFRVSMVKRACAFTGGLSNLLSRPPSPITRAHASADKSHPCWRSTQTLTFSGLGFFEPSGLAQHSLSFSYRHTWTW